MRSGKLLFLASALTLSAGTGIAQSIPAAFEDISTVAPLLHNLHLDFAARAHINVPPRKIRNTAKTTAVQSRLYAIAGFSYDGVSFYPTDSTHNSFAADRGGDFRTPYIKYDASQVLTYDAPGMPLKNEQRYLQTFDANNVLLNRTEQFWYPSIADWASSNQFTRTLSATGKTLTERYQVWNAVADAWENTQQYTNTYDPAGDRLAAVVQETWDITTASWINNWKYTDTYDAAGNLTMTVTQAWDAASSSWVNNTRETYCYNSKQKILNHLFQKFNTATAAWVNDNQMIYQYDPAGLLLTTEALQSWDMTAWKNIYKYLYAYGGTGALNTMVLQYWSTSGSSWINQQLDLYEYNSTGDNTDHIVRSWDDATTSWVNITHQESGYDSKHNNIQVLNSSWNSASTKWDSGKREQSVHNSDDQLTMYSTDQWNAGGFWETTTSNNKLLYYYEEYTTGITPAMLKAASLKLFPVPAADELHIALQWDNAQPFTVTVYDLHGRVWQSWQQPATTTYRSTIPTGQLPAGQYLLQFRGHKDGFAIQQFTVIH